MQFTQTILGFTASGSGLLLLFRALPVMLLAPAVAGLVGAGRLDVRITIATGSLLNAIGSWWIGSSTTTLSGFGQFLPGLIIGGLGTAMLFIPLLIAVQTATPAEDAPKASSFLTLAFQLRGSISSALLVTMLDRRADFHLDVLGANLTAHNVALAGLTALTPQQLYGIVVAQAQTIAFADVGYAVALIAALMIPIVFLLKHTRPVAGAGVSFE